MPSEPSRVVSGPCVFGRAMILLLSLSTLTPLSPPCSSELTAYCCSFCAWFIGFIYMSSILLTCKFCAVGPAILERVLWEDRVVMTYFVPQSDSVLRKRCRSMLGLLKSVFILNSLDISH